MSVAIVDCMSGFQATRVTTNEGVFEDVDAAPAHDLLPDKRSYLGR